MKDSEVAAFAEFQRSFRKKKETKKEYPKISVE